MKYAITEQSGFSLATITKPGNTTIAYLSADIHTEATAHKRASELLYTDALISGAGKYNRAAFLDAINSLGATVSVSIGDGVLTVFIKSTSGVFPKVVKLVEVMLTSPQFDPKELKRIKQTTINAIKESKEDSRAIAHEGLRNTFYGVHDRRYTHDEDTLIKEVSKVTGADLKKLHAQFGSLDWTASIAGNKDDVAAFSQLLKKLKGTQKKTHTEQLGIHQQKPPKQTLVLRDIPSRQNIDFSIGAPIPITVHHPDFLPLMFGLAVLGKWGGFAGRLMSTVREQEGLTYGIYAKTETFMNEEQGYWRIMTFFAPEKSVQGLTSTFREITNIHKHGITRDEHQKFRDIIHTSQVLKNDSTSSLLAEFHSYHLQKFSLEEIAAHKQRILSVSREEVNEALRHYLDPHTLTISAAGPVAAVRKDLQQFLKTVS